MRRVWDAEPTTQSLRRDGSLRSRLARELVATRALRREAGGAGLAVVGVALVYLSPIPAEYRGTLAKGAVVLAAGDRGQIPGREVVVATKNCLHVLAPAIGGDAGNPV